ncbi:MAG: alanine racemase [Candidatus Omnitrophica bacterium]|nr:alanine racemase [Candidatus Omnitrophota bacterium]
MKKEFFRPTIAEIDLGALEYNFRQIKRRVSSHTKILVTVKADAYGHGILRVSKRLVRCGVDYLGVASLDEAVCLRRAGVKCPILVLGVIFPEQAGTVIDHDLTQTVCTLDVCRALDRLAARRHKRVSVHVKIDTGMGRLGVSWGDAEEFISALYKQMKHVSIEGIFTHFPRADDNKALTGRQISMFSALVRRLEKKGIFILFKHCANSMAVLDYPGSHFNLIRPGLIIYGLYPKDGLDIRLKPAMGLKSKIVFMKSVKKGTPLSYGHTYITSKDTSVAVVPIGYGDGYSRGLSNKAQVLIKGRRFPVVGTICMDQILVDTGRLKAKVGDEVVLIGRQGKQAITAEEIARLTRTIPYEVVCQVGRRVPRIYR